jgi:Carboxypeptidase regulatory-like domain/TonB dependent receptor-like, beta-barrel
MVHGVHSKCKSFLNGLALFLAVILFAIAPAVARAQVSAINAGIRGRVTDPADAALPEAQVTVKNTATGYTRTTSSGADGYYVLSDLPIGTYTVTIEKQGFATLTFPGVVLETGNEAVMNGTMKVGAVTTTVTVSSGAPILEPSSVFVGSTISQLEVTNLPLTSRNPYNFILFQPGISGHPNPELGIPRTINTNGQMDRIRYEIDGMENTETDVFGLRAYPISDSYVREVQTITDSFAPEFGDTTGDTYNVITGSGTNDFHGLLYWLNRPIADASRPMLLSPTATKPDLEELDYVANAGGAILKNKLFYFGSYEHMRRGGPAPITITSANAAAIGLPASQLDTPPSVEHSTFADTRLDWTINSKNQAFLRLNYFRNEYPYNSTVGGLNALDNAIDFHDRAYILAAQIVTTISPTMLNEFRFSWGYRNEKHEPGALTGPGPAIDISGAADFGGTTGGISVFQEKQPSLYDNVTYVHGAHTFKQGFYLDQVLDNQASATSDTYNFSSIANYLEAESGSNPYAYSTYSTLFGNTELGYHSFFWGAYWQDSWQLNPKLMVIYGLRYDKFQPPPAEANAPYIDTQHFNSPSGNFQPRVGVAWQVSPKTVVRASFGKFYDQPAVDVWYDSLYNDGSGRFVSATFTPTSAGAPAFPNLIRSVSSLGTQSITTVSPNLKDPYALTTTLQVSRQLTSNDSLTIGYQLTEGHQLWWQYNSNLINPIGELADGRPIYSSTVNSSTRLDPAFNNISMQASGANSNYNALLVDYHHRFSEGLEMGANYTWSHTISDAPDLNSFEQSSPVEDPSDRQRDRGNSSVNRPDSFNASVIYDPTFSISDSFPKYIFNGNTFAFLVVAQSGDEQNITTGTLLNGDSTTSSVTRPVFVGRNTVRGPKIVQFDTRYTRDLFTWHERITPQFLFEVNNLFNDHHNITSLNTSVPVNAAGYPLLPSGAVGLPTSFPFRSTVLEARIIQFGLALRW